MDNETAKELAAAMNRLAAALESLKGAPWAGGGINVYHHGAPSYGPHNPLSQPTYRPAYGNGDHGF